MRMNISLTKDENALNNFPTIKKIYPQKHNDFTQVYKDLTAFFPFLKHPIPAA